MAKPPGLTLAAKLRQRVRRQRRVPHPAVAVIPVALAARPSPAARSWGPPRSPRSARRSAPSASTPNARPHRDRGRPCSDRSRQARHHCDGLLKTLVHLPGIQRGSALARADAGARTGSTVAAAPRHVSGRPRRIASRSARSSPSLQTKSPSSPPIAVNTSAAGATQPRPHRPVVKPRRHLEAAPRRCRARTPRS